MKINKCLHCGYSAELKHRSIDRESGSLSNGHYWTEWFYWVECLKCKSRGPEGNQEDAVLTWNRRL